MRTHWRKTFMLALLLSAVAPTRSVASGTSVVTEREIYSAMDERVRADAADRQVVLDLLGRPEARDLAAKAGLSPERARNAVRSLTGTELRSLADHARIAQQNLAGGDTLIISATTLIIILLIIIIIVAAD